jgi:manganese transport protein
MPMATPSTDRQNSMAEVHSTVATEHVSIWKRMFAFAGPAYLVSVGYMDPGNWATDLEGGARFGYQLLWVLVMSNAMAILLQTLSARLGIASGRDLAQACRETYPKPIAQALWALCEVAIAACDLAEVLGAAIGLNLLFGIPLLLGVLVTIADTLLVLWFSRYGIRAIESVILALISIIGVCFLIEIVLAKPDATAVARGLIPRLNGQTLYIAIGILGATVMPHNLYLHSSLVQTRQIAGGDQAKRVACHWNLIDSVVALNGALLVNAAILILAGSIFFTKGIVVTEIQQAHQLLAPLLGTTFASAAFAIALLCSGQSSTITGTMAGQIVMEGFLNFRMRPWLRRIITRSLAIIPAALTIWLAGEQSTFKLLILSQVILSLQLPFAVIPLIHFTSDPKRMGAFANRAWVKVLSWSAAAIIVALNLWLGTTSILSWIEDAGAWRPVVILFVVPLALVILLLLAWVTFEPWITRRRGRLAGKEAVPLPLPASPSLAPAYQVILVPLDHTTLDQSALSHAVTMAKMYAAHLELLHVEEGVPSQVYGEMASTAETEKGRRYLNDLLEGVRSQGVSANLRIVHGTDPTSAIVEAARETRADLLVMGAHGHKGIKDIVFGATINEVRHRVDAPLLIVHARRSDETPPGTP